MRDIGGTSLKKITDTRVFTNVAGFNNLGIQGQDVYELTIKWTVILLASPILTRWVAFFGEPRRSIQVSTGTCRSFRMALFKQPTHNSKDDRQIPNDKDAH